MTKIPTRRAAAEFVRNPRFLLYVYVVLLAFFIVWTWVCSPWGLAFGQKLAKDVGYVTFISHVALILSMVGAVASQIVAVAQYEDAAVQDVLDEVKKD